MMAMRTLLLFLLCCSDLAGQKFVYSETHMGTEFRLTFYADDSAAADHAAAAAFARIAEIDSRLSDYQPTSELNLLNATAKNGPGDWTAVSDDLWRVLLEAQRINQLSSGSFDVTLGPCVKLWRRAQRQNALPTGARLTQALASCGGDKLQLDPVHQKVRLSATAMQLDLGGIAKGDALDQALQVLAEHGVKQALVDGGGDVAASGPPPGSEGWKIHLSEGRLNGQNMVLLVHAAIATSGYRYQNIQFGGVQYSHIIDPTTGLGLTTPRAATVQAPSGILADALASALCVSGPDGLTRMLKTMPQIQAAVYEKPAPAGLPNIIFIMADDLGWSDLACFGSDYYRTPNLDRLATEGLQMRHAYSAGPNCAPTRAALMSGQSAPHTGIYTVLSGARGKAKNRRLTPPENRTELAPEIVTLAESLQNAGYRTGHFGKWHLGGSPETRPEAQGFEVNVGGSEAGHPPTYFWPYRKSGQSLPGMQKGSEGEYLNDRLTDEAIAFIRQEDRRPFFLYLPHYAVHTPIQAPEADVAHWKDRPVGRKHNNPTYAAMIENLDANVGRLLAVLDEMQIAQNTVVVFYSDNGGLGGYKDAGLPGIEVTNNAPLRGGKGMLYEGGIRVPLIVRWPGKIAAGIISDEPVTTVDFYPTLLELADLPSRPMPVGKGPFAHLEGITLLPLWTGRVSKLPSRDLYWHFPGYLGAGKDGWRTTPAGAVRSERYKLIEFFETGQSELYDLLADPGERNDLSASQPEIHDQLLRSLKSWRQIHHARMPVPVEQ
jgi:arylsulfatase A-like enzyme/thiamine biosynthesis lipoprotein ApbE